MKVIKKVKRIWASIGSRFLFFGFLAFLVGCGGGSSSSGTGGGKEATQFAGNYGGFETLRLSGPGGTFPAGTFPLSVNIMPDGRVTVTDSDFIPYQGRLGGAMGQFPPNKFIATQFIRIATPPGFFCRPNTFGYIGIVKGNIITGNANGRFLCSGRGRTAWLTLSGPFRATRGAPGVGPGITPPTQPQGAPGNRKSRKQKAISDGVGSVF